MRCSNTLTSQPPSSPAWTWVLAAALCCAAPGSHAATHPEKTQAASTAKKSKSVKIKHSQNHSGESPAERDRRLYRECKGMPNAGACLGYTRK